MTPEEAIQHLRRSCLKDHEGRYFFSCKEGFVAVRLRGIHDPLRFPARDRVAFRIGATGLQIERPDNGIVAKFFGWNEIESLMAGEPEMTGGALFQG